MSHKILERFIEAHKAVGTIQDPSSSSVASLKSMRGHMEVMDHVERHIKLSTEEDISQTIISQDYVETLISLLPLRMLIDKKLEVASTNAVERKKQYEIIKNWIHFNQRFLSKQGITVNKEAHSHVTMTIQDNVQRNNNGQSSYRNSVGESNRNKQNSNGYMNQGNNRNQPHIYVMQSIQNSFQGHKVTRSHNNVTL